MRTSSSPSDTQNVLKHCGREVDGYPQMCCYSALCSSVLLGLSFTPVRLGGRTLPFSNPIIVSPLSGVIHSSKTLSFLPVGFLTHQEKVQSWCGTHRSWGTQKHIRRSFQTTFQKTGVIICLEGRDHIQSKGPKLNMILPHLGS